MSDFDIIAQWTVCVVVTLVLLIRGQLTPFHPTSFYLFFHAVVFCLRPTLVKYADFDTVILYMRLEPSPGTLSKTLWVSSFALVVFCAAFGSVAAGAKPWTLGEPPKITRGMRISFWVMGVIMAGLGFFSVFGANIQGHHVGGVYVMTGTSGYVNELQQVFVPLVVLFAFVHGWKWWSFAPLLWFIFYRATQGHARWMMIYPLIYLILIYLWQNKRTVPPLKFIVPLPFVLLLFMTLSHNRYIVQQWWSGQEVENKMESEELSTKEKWDTMDFANYDFLAYIIETVPEKTRSFNYGAQHLQLFTEPIPRKLWPGKPVGAPIEFCDWTSKRWGNTLGITPSIVGDGWVNYAWIGVTINMIVYGVALAALYNWFLLHGTHVFRGLLYLMLTSILVQVYRDGGIVSMAKFLLFTTMPILFWWWLYTYVIGRDEVREADERAEAEARGEMVDTEKDDAPESA